jgi:ABC-2 type transport system ATP-binding protein
LVGPNRAGKTTLVKVLLSLARLTSGQAMRFGKSVRDRSTLAKVGYVHENHAFPRYLSATALLEYYGALNLMRFEEIKQRVPKLLDKVGLADRQRDIVSSFSKGMIQRLGLAQALLNDPDLLVMDEPNEGLDQLARGMVADVIREQRAKGKTVILVSHVATEVEQLCDRIAILKDGKLAHLGSVAELTHRGAKDGKTRPLSHALQEIYEKGPR